jgi:hypothetical protein
MGADVQTTFKEKRRWRWINPVVRIGATLQVVLVVLQASLAGLSLTGSSEALVWHERIGTEYVTLLGLIVLLLAVLNWRPGRGPGVAGVRGAGGDAGVVPANRDRVLAHVGRAPTVGRADLRSKPCHRLEAASLQSVLSRVGAMRMSVGSPGS